MKKRLITMTLSCLLSFGALIGCGHKHTLVEVPAYEGTCIEEGNIQYWHCEGCDKYFVDEAATQEITLEETVTDFGPHHYVEVAEKAPTEQADGWIAHLECELCGQLALGDLSNPEECDEDDIKIEKLVYYTVTYVVDGKQVSSERVLKGGNPASIPAGQTKTADLQYTYTWNGWYVGEVEFTNEAVINVDTTVEGKFDKTAIIYTITFKQDGHDDVVEDFSAEDKVVTEPALDPVAGYNVAWSSYDLNKYEDQICTVIKTPRTDTAYTVKHYALDAQGNYDKPFAVDNLTGTTGAKTSAIAKSYSFLTPKSFNQADILGDGSTVVNIFYDRAKWSITPDSNGTYETITSDAPGTYESYLRLNLTANQWGIAWTRMAPNFTKEELASSNGIYLLARFHEQPTQGVNVMCSNNNHFATGLAKDTWHTIHLGMDQILADYQQKTNQTTVDEAYACMADSNHQAFGFYYRSGLASTSVIIDIADMQLDTFGSDNFAFTIHTANDDQPKTAAYINGFNKALYNDVPNPAEGANGSIRVSTTTASWGGADLRLKLGDLYTMAELNACSTIDLKVYVVGDENMTFNGFIVDPHYAQNQPCNQWVTLHIPYSEFRGQANAGDDTAFFNNIQGGWIRTTKFQFKRSGSPLNSEAVVFFIGGVSLSTNA